MRLRLSSIDKFNQEITLVPPSSADRSSLKRWVSITEDEINKLGGVALPATVEKKGKIRKRSLNYISLAFIAYFAVAGGPFGIEDAVKAAGAFPVLLAVILLPFTWGLPQALMTAELSTMMDENGGYILWVRRGLGEFAGFMNAFNSIASNLCDLPTYPVLFASAINYNINSLERWFIKCGSLILIFICNILGIRAVALSSVAMSFFILAPFLIEPIVCFDKFNLSSITNTNDNINWSLFLSTILWNYQGWDSLGCVAGEVEEGSRTYPLGFFLVMVLITINYIVPVASGIAIFPDSTKWNEGMLETIASSISPWLGTWVALAAVFSTLGQFLVVMACSSRALWATAEYRMLPKFLSYEWARYGTPVAAITLQTITTAFLMSFSFAQLVVMDTFFSNLTLLCEFISYLRLKYVEPNTKRPFVVPGGLTGAWLITTPKILILLGVLSAQDSKAWTFCGGFNLILLVAYKLWKKYHVCSNYSPLLPPETSLTKSYSTC